MDGMENFVEVTLPTSDDFLKTAETLTRIGVASRPQSPDERPRLYQSCHILHKRGKYYILHFKELFLLDGKVSTLSESDIARRNTIANLLQEWGLLKIVDPAMVATPRAPVTQIKIISHRDKANYDLVAKYTIGKKR